MKATRQPAPAAPGWLSKPENQCMVVIAIGVLIYLNTLTHGFVLDDEAVIAKNRFVQQGLSGWKDILSTFYWKGYWDENSGLFRPLSLLMFSLEWQLFPGSPWVHHAVQLLVYGLLLGVLFKWLHEWCGKTYPLVPFAALLLFATHPMHTEVVANIKSRDELLCLLFFAWSAWSLLKDLKAPSLTHKIASPLFFFLALLSKEAAILFLPVLFLMLWLLKELKWQEALKKLLPYLAVTGLWGIWYFLVLSFSEDAVIAYSYLDNSLLATPDPLQRFATATGLVGRYIWKTILPVSFSYDYSFNEIPVVGLASLTFIVSFAAVLGAFFVAYRSWKNNPGITFSILFFFITLTLASNVFKLIGTTFAERLLFSPSLGFCLLVALGLNAWLNKQNEKLNAGVLTICVVLSLFYTVKTFHRNKDWKSNLTLYAKDASTGSNSARVHFNYGTILLNEALPAARDPQQASHDLGQAIDHLERSVKIDPIYAQAYVNLGVAYFKARNYTASIAASRKALQWAPNDAAVMTNLADAYLLGGWYDSSIVYHTKSIARNYIQKDTYNFLGTAWFNKKQYTKAIAAFQQGIRRDSTYAGLWLNYGNALAMNNQYPQAIIAFDQAYRFDPSNRQALHFKAMSYYRMGDEANARKWEEAFNRRP